MKSNGRFIGLALLLLIPATTRAQEKMARTEVGHDIVVEAGQELQEAVCIGCSVYVRGSVAGDVVALGGRIEVDGGLAGDAVAIGGGLRIGAGAKVAGDVVAVGGRVDRDARAAVAGEVTAVPFLPGTGIVWFLLLGLLFFAIVDFILLLICYLFVGERRAEVMAATIRQRGGLSFLAGLGVLVVTAILLVVASQIRAAGTILAIAVCLALIVTLLVGLTGASFWLGRALTKSGGALPAVLFGALLLTVLQAVPVAGLLVSLILVPVALGVAALSGFGSNPEWLTQRLSGRPTASPPMSGA